LEAQEEKFKAVFIYSFTRNIEWPAIVIKDNFIICVLGESKIVQELKDLASTKKISNRTVAILMVQSGQSIPDCNVLFITKENDKQISSTSKLLGTKPVLIISDRSSGCKFGAGINFILRNQNLNFEINKTNILARGLLVNTQILSLGTIVE
jgi:hypothetical protein